MDKIKTVISGSFRKEPEGLNEQYKSLVNNDCEILSPLDINFVSEIDGFVLAEHEKDKDPRDVETAHLEAIEQADFLWLYAPNGYVGISATLELGFAHALGIPVFGEIEPTDLGLSGMVKKVESPAEAIKLVLDSDYPTIPAKGLTAMTAYYKKAAQIRGYDEETIGDTLLLLTEELGELARAVRKHKKLRRDGEYNKDLSIVQELADIQLYLFHLANICEVNLADAVIMKETDNIKEFNRQKLS